MAKSWRIRDVIDFEYFLDRDEDGTEGRDRQIYLEYAENLPDPENRRAVFKYWLKRRRKAAAEDDSTDTLPGEIYAEAAAAANLILGTLALLSGAAITWSVLSYGGTTPVNVFTCLWVLLAPQALLLVILAVSSCIYRFRSQGRGAKGLYALISALVLRVSRRALHYGASKAPQSKQNSLRSALGIAGQTRSIYGGLFFWPVFNIAQTAGVAFNLGILAAMLLRITITDVAFGWQSTLQPDPHTVYRIIEIIAAPWAWFADPPVAHPTAAQIAGSRMVLKDGIYHLATGDLISWWPFLCLSVAFYGLLPRVLLLVLGLWRRNRVLAGLKFTHAACERLWRQMTVPQVKTASRPYAGSAGKNRAEAPFENEAAKVSEETGLMSAVVAVPEEMELDGKILAEEMKTRLGLVPTALIRITGDPEADTEKIIPQKDKMDSSTKRLVIIQESWQPPIKESLAWIRSIKKAAGPDAAVVICLVGRPIDRDCFTGPVQQTEQVIWKQAINSLADPYIRVEILGEQGSDER